MIQVLTLKQLKDALFKQFSVNNTTELRKRGSLQLFADEMNLNSLDLRSRQSWEVLYRKFVGILPGEDNEQGPHCINGINVFKYFRPWQVFGLDPTVATRQDIHDAYSRLAKLYGSRDADSSDRLMLDEITVMYQSLIAVPG